MADIKAGDVVVLKSGGPDMTVQKVGEWNGSMTAWCQWFDEKKPQADRFELSSLKPKGGI
jgi:uncharacterized protein YodC (DUF2158 family)